MRRRIQLVVGFAVYLIAFFLPAVKATDGDVAGLQGWVCAAWSLVLSFAVLRGGLQSLKPDHFLLILSGLVNPLMVVYLGLWAWPRFARIRMGIGAAVGAGLVSSWVYLVTQKFALLAGHFLWVAGILIILSTEIGRPGKRVPEVER